jgi:hypothetical protein
MRPSQRIDQIAQKLVRAHELDCQRQGTAMGPADIAIILCRATADYLDEEWEKNPQVTLQ